mmetsp:Transcript_11684/g.22634  ORF Transcript_11684/g.22634 Transcript_11684/m.22634 type:complete len:477 (+) Transcript_11684:164-1594(+)
MARAPVASQVAYTGLASSADPSRPPQNNCLGCCTQDRNEDQPVGWSYVGEGRGKYQQVDHFDFVGEGSGDYEQETIQVRKNLWFRNFCLGTLCCATLSMALVSLLYLGLRYNAATPSGSSYQVVASPNRPGTYERYDCLMGLESWRTSWSTEQKEWCCEHHHRGCRRFNCHADYSQRALEWSVEKMAWCCQYEKVGCSLGCNAKCIVKGEAASCQERIRWASANVYKHQSDACGLAHGLVLGECQICASCLLDASGCNQTRAYDCFAGLRNYEAGWSASKKQWCCARMGVACPFDCDAGFSNWRQGWSEAKRQWCCRYAKRGCTTTTTLPSEPYDCEAGILNWVNGWSDSKKYWCCREYSRGCSTTQSPPNVVTSISGPAGNSSNTTLTTTILFYPTLTETTTATPLVTSTMGNNSNATPSSPTTTPTSTNSSSSSNSSTNATSTTTVTTTGTTTATTTVSATATNTTPAPAPIPA